jgi:hypothetical protein
MPYIPDKITGDIGEQKIQQAMKLRGIESAILFGKNSAGDITFGKSKLIEVKTDDYAWKKLLTTGKCNLAFEFEGKTLSTGIIRPTGISITESAFWVQILGDTFVWFHTEELKKYLNDHPEFDRKWSREGTGHNILAPFHTIKNDSIFHWQALPKEEHEPNINS